jgi:glycosyltransferase involved in cell wall biosynthesis
MEAAACGRAMIASDVPGCREIVVQDQTGLLFPVDNALALADAMGRLAGDASLRERYAMAARKLVIERFAAEIIGRQTVALYKRVINKTLDTDHSLFH